MRNGKHMVYAISICIISIGIFLSLSGCIYLGTVPPAPPVPPVANGHVYLDGNVVSGATVEAISANGADRKSTITDSNGAYTLNITPATTYNITATYQGFRHTIWPVYLDNKTDTFNITLTSTPKSTIEGTGEIGGDRQFNTKINEAAINLMSATNNNATISKRMNSDGSYSVEVEPNVPYIVNGNIVAMGLPIAQFNYHNTPEWLDTRRTLTVGPNETVLIDIRFIVP